MISHSAPLIFALWACFLGFLGPALWAQVPPDAARQEAPAVVRKSLPARAAQATPIIDGRLSDSIWQQGQLPPAEGFVTRFPSFGEPIPDAFRTRVRVFYTAEGLYIGAEMLDPQPDSILTQFTERDIYDENNDWFGVALNPFRDGLNDFNFWITAAGTIAESRTTADGEVLGWNTIWSAAAHRHDSGWSCEMRIPYVALRFPAEGSQDWGLNFTRSVRRHRVRYSWNLVDPNSGYREEFQTGLLHGVQMPNAPLRLSLLPFVQTQVNRFEGENSFNFNAGLDLKYGVNESFTLDMTLIPDFSQVAVDEQFVNLSPFENRFEETRQFFTEGTELFTIGNLFYSRRIGGTPKNITNVNLQDTGVVEVQAEFTRLLNATKFSGRTDGNLGIGVLNAVTAASYSTLTDAAGNEERLLTEPLTNYNVLVLDQRFKDNSSVSLINTNTLRQGGSADANVVGLLTSVNLADARYRIDAAVKRSDRFLEGGASAQTGHQVELRLGDVSGRWRWAILQDLRTEDYEINDLGFLARNNQVRTYAELGYQTFRPSGKLNRQEHQIFGARSNLMSNGRFEDFFLAWRSFWLYRNFFAWGFTANARPINTYNYFEPRRAGFRFELPPRYSLSSFISTDYRKPLAWDIRGSVETVPQFNSRSYSLELAPRWRWGDHFFTVLSSEYRHTHNDVGFADTSALAPVFGSRELRAVTNSLTGRYVFNPRTTLALSLRHLWTGLRYTERYLLLPEGQLEANDGALPENLNFNNLNLDLRLSWWFAPASEITLLYRHIVAASGSTFVGSYGANFEDLFSLPAQSNLSLRVSYFLDYQQSVKPRLDRG